MKLVKINSLLVSEAERHHDTSQQAFNTCFHPAALAPGLPLPDERPYSFKRWLPIILQTRQAPQPLDTNTTTTTTTTIPPSKQSPSPPANPPPPRRHRSLPPARRAQPDLPRRPRRPHPPHLARPTDLPPAGLFLRLAACSPKDGGNGPLRDAEAAVARLVTSVRARNALVHCLERGEGAELFFLPFDGRMEAGREYRVFCCPGDGRVVGVSQYKWYRAWRVQDSSEGEQERVVRRVVGGAEEVRGLILGEVQRRGDGLDRLMMEQGFSFDLFYDEDADRCELVELNTFGVRSGCGSCLFQWVEDRGVLYGEKEPEFRVSVDMGPVTVRVSRLGEEGEGGVESTEFCGDDWRGFIRSFD
ncbi:hypothetical protein B0I37DRAFT_428579 [Chaetomium sp. MPI-CAGE-AT-0009]|nr:hypothetical protein B0I37DRAFT_428579 [Chaetomium sp. MPI-CAGE-AT-0009]